MRECSKIIENSQIGMSRHLDSSSTTQLAQIMGMDVLARDDFDEVW